MEVDTKFLLSLESFRFYVTPFLKCIYVFKFKNIFFIWVKVWDKILF